MLGKKHKYGGRQKKGGFSDRKHHGGHFIIPESQGGTNSRENIYTPWAGHNHPQHIAWHTLFGNFFPQEAIALIRLWTRRDGRLNLKYFPRYKGKPGKRLRAWTTLFGHRQPSEAIAWIEREFIRKEWL